MNRREFLIGCTAGAGLIASSSWRLLAAPYDTSKLTGPNHTTIVLFLRGGCDGLNLVAPVSDSHYNDARERKLKLTDKEGFRIEQEFGKTGFRFHPEAGGIKRLYDRGDLAIVQACGLINPTRSHFHATDLIERGLTKEDLIYDGWMARYLNELQTNSIFPGVSVTNGMSESFLGTSHAISMRSLLDYKYIDHIYDSDLVRALYREDEFMKDIAFQAADTVDFVENTLTNTQREELKKGVFGYPTDWTSLQLSKSLQTVAKLIKMDTGVSMIDVDYDGWDTHERQNEVFPALVKGLSGCLEAFYNDIAEYKQNVTVVVMSEFGRRLRSNASRGTDHGHGNLMFVLGGAVNGGKIYGDWPGLEPELLDRGVDMAVTTDYRNVLSNVLKQKMNYNNLNHVFPGFKNYSDMGLFR